MKKLLIAVLTVISFYSFGAEYIVNPKDVDIRIMEGNYLQALLTASNQVRLVVLTGEDVQDVKIIPTCVGKVNSVLKACAYDVEQILQDAESESKKVKITTQENGWLINIQSLD